MVSRKKPLINPWWVYVIVTPDCKSIKVLINGVSKGFKGFIPLGGHWHPIAIEGDKAQ